MKIHEYQAKELLAAKGIPVPAQILAVTPEEAASYILSGLAEGNGPIILEK